MNIILLSGGSGQRLWPLSNEERSKQFINIFKKKDGSYESMVQRVFRQIRGIDSNSMITIATSKSQVSSIQNQVGKDVGISIEPYRRDTFPAIALATAYIHDIQGVQEDEVVVVCPVDPYVDETYFEAIKELGDLAQNGEANLYLLGMEPTYPSEKYGYIIPKTVEQISSVKTFKEKPDKTTAEEYMKQGALWNGGVFAYKLGYVLKRAHELIDFVDYQDLYKKYFDLEKISFDYAVVEKEPQIIVKRFSGVWKDLGTWDTLTEVMEEPVIGDANMDEKCNNTSVINELGIPIICMGIENAVVAASPQGILVAEKKSTDAIKTYVEKLNKEIMFADKSWGKYRVLDVSPDSMTIKLELNAGGHTSYHNHQKRNEVWTILSGEGKAIIDGVERLISKGDTIAIDAGTRHTICARTDMVIIEVQMGREISVDDKMVYELEI